MNFDTLAARPRTWLITGVAGFIGSNLLEALLRLDQRVVGLDNFATGHRRNLDEVAGLVAFLLSAAASYVMAKAMGGNDILAANILAFTTVVAMFGMAIGAAILRGLGWI